MILNKTEQYYPAQYTLYNLCDSQVVYILPQQRTFFTDLKVVYILPKQRTFFTDLKFLTNMGVSLSITMLFK